MGDFEGGGGGKNDLRGAAEVEVEVEVEGTGCSGPKSRAGAIPARARKDVNRCTSDSRSVSRPHRYSSVPQFCGYERTELGY